MYYVRRGGYAILPQRTFLFHVGYSAGNKYSEVIYPNAVVSKKLTKDYNDYQNWVK